MAKSAAIVIHKPEEHFGSLRPCRLRSETACMLFSGWMPSAVTRRIHGGSKDETYPPVYISPYSIDFVHLSTTVVTFSPLAMIFPDKPSAGLLVAQNASMTTHASSAFLVCSYSF